MENTKLLWWDDASYIRYQSEDRGAMAEAEADELEYSRLAAVIGDVAVYGLGPYHGPAAIAERLLLALDPLAF